METVSGLIPLILVIAIMYFLLIRPQKRRVEEHRRLTESIEPGDRIVTIGGLHGTVRSIGDEEIQLEVSDGVTLHYAKSAIARRLTESLPSSASTPPPSSSLSGGAAPKSLGSGDGSDGASVTAAPKSTGAKSTSSKTAAGKSTGAKSTATKSTSAKKTTAKSTAKKTTAKKTTSRSTAGRSRRS